MHKEVAIIILNWNSFNYTFNCIRSVKETAGNNYEIILVDNHSEDGSGLRLKAIFPDIIFIQTERNAGFAGGNNPGLRYAIENGFKYSLLLNNDTEVTKDFLSPLLDYMEMHPEAGVIQPAIYFNKNRSSLWNGGSYFIRFLGLPYCKNNLSLFKNRIFAIKKVDWVTGCAFLTRNSILEQTGLLDERFFMYYEDIDLSFRIKQLGYELIYYPASVIYHEANTSLKEITRNKEGNISPFLHYIAARSRMIFLKKYTTFYTFPSIVLFHLLYAAAFSGYFIIRGRFIKLKSFVSGLRDGLLGKPFQQSR